MFFNFISSLLFYLAFAPNSRFTWNSLWLALIFAPTSLESKALATLRPSWLPCKRWVGAACIRLPLFSISARLPYCSALPFYFAQVKVPKFEPRSGVTIETDEKKAAEAVAAQSATRRSQALLP